LKHLQNKFQFGHDDECVTLNTVINFSHCVARVICATQQVLNY